MSGASRVRGVRVAEDVAWVELGPDPDRPDEIGVVAAVLPAGPPLAMRGSAALIWLAAVAGGPLDEVVARVARSSGQPVAVVEPDVRALVEDLVARGALLEGEVRPGPAVEGSPTS